MIVPEMTKVAIDKFKQKMAELGQNLDTQQLTAQLAQQVTAVLRDALTAAGAAAVQTFVQSYNPTDPLLDVNGWRMRFKMISPKEFLTCFGPMVIERSLYQADTGGRSYVPLDDFWDMAGEFATAEVREAVLFSVAHVTPGEAEQLLRKCALFGPSATAIKHIVKPVGDFIETRGEDLDSAIRAEEVIPKEARVLVASLDGVNVLLKEPGVKRGRPAKRPGLDASPVQPTSYKNAMVGSISFYGTVPRGRDCPQRLASKYVARMPENEALTFKQQFEMELAEVEDRLPEKVVKVLLLDGHRTLWNYAEGTERFADYEKLIDYYHTTEHLSKAAEHLFGKGNRRALVWYNKYRVKLLEDDDAPAAILRSLDYYRHRQMRGKTRRKALLQERTFFSHNQQRMTYASFRRRCLPIGNGPVEAACKTLVKTRLCRSGMRWSRVGGQRILSLRTYVKSQRWDSFWHHYLNLRQPA
jgi:hypothetical protein